MKTERLFLNSEKDIKVIQYELSYEISFSNDMFCMMYAMLNPPLKRVLKWEQ